ncbi:unnamed protein product [Fraxinus pennsylvanica]|uniref:Uncharacterized protein n=1 Tax=Fraxinus pennsylvanica TaxID=56036 RepID=A0AAD2A334_9LAMI|nr:unnamed protein product [Fraxinus pennsylvanica]
MGVLAILGETVKTVECFITITTASATKCNGSTIGDCIPINEEFLMESEISRRILAQRYPGITYKTSNAAKPFCDANAYHSCIDNKNTNFNKRPCNSVISAKLFIYRNAVTNRGTVALGGAGGCGGAETFYSLDSLAKDRENAHYKVKEVHVSLQKNLK